MAPLRHLPPPPPRVRAHCPPAPCSQPWVVLCVAALTAGWGSVLFLRLPLPLARLKKQLNLCFPEQAAVICCLPILPCEAALLCLGWARRFA